MPQRPKRRTKEIAIPASGAHPLIAGVTHLFRRRRREVVGGAVAVLVALIAVFALYRAPDDCRRSSERRVALDSVRGAKERLSGESLGRQLRSAHFRCTEPRAGEGVFVAANDGSGGEEGSRAEAMVWYVNAAGAAHNVNLLAQAWTPDLPPAPYFEPAEIQRVARGD